MPAIFFHHRYSREKPEDYQRRIARGHIVPSLNTYKINSNSRLDTFNHAPETAAARFSPKNYIKAKVTISNQHTSGGNSRGSLRLPFPTQRASCMMENYIQLTARKPLGRHTG